MTVHVGLPLNQAPMLSRREVLAGTAAVAASPWLTALCLGQGKAKTKTEEVPKPENVSFDSKDHVQLSATYYPGTLKKKAVPILMVHGWEGQRGEYHLLAQTIQSYGHAVLTVDLRGHGQSTRQKTARGIEEIELDKLNAPKLEQMVFDIEACKKFLVEKHNASELNIEALCVVAAGFGCTIAMKWAVLDWAAPRLAAYKQGQDVKGLVLLSPMESFKGVTTRDVMATPIIRKGLSIMICVGDGEAKSLQDAKRMHTTLSRFRKEPPADPEEAAQKQDLFYIPVETKLQGTQLLDRALPTIRDVAKFIGLRMVAKMDEFEPWTERKNPLGN